MLSYRKEPVDCYRLKFMWRSIGPSGAGSSHFSRVFVLSSFEGVSGTWDSGASSAGRLKILNATKICKSTCEAFGKENLIESAAPCSWDVAQE